MIVVDDLWMSICYGCDFVVIYFCWKNDWLVVQCLLFIIESKLVLFDFCFYWGKFFVMLFVLVQLKYEKLVDFVKFVVKYDLKGKFCNEFFNINVFINCNL